VAARIVLIVCLVISHPARVFGQDLVWESPPGNYARYEIRIEDKNLSQVKKFAGERTLDLTLGLRFIALRDDVVPILVTVERYAVSEKDQQGFAMTYDTTKKPDEDTEYFQKTAVELCQRLYPVGMESNVSLVRFREFSTDTMESRSVAEQFSNDLRLALSIVLVPLDGGDKRKPRSWTVTEEWNDLQTPVPMTIEHRLTSTEDPKPDQKKLGVVAKMTFRGSGQAQQGEGATAFTSKVAVEGEYGFECLKPSSGRTVQSLKSTETLTTDDAFKSSRTRRATVKLVASQPERKFTQEEIEFQRGIEQREHSSFHPRSLAGKK